MKDRFTICEIYLRTDGEVVIRDHNTPFDDHATSADIQEMFAFARGVLESYQKRWEESLIIKPPRTQHDGSIGIMRVYVNVLN